MDEALENTISKSADHTNRNVSKYVEGEHQDSGESWQAGTLSKNQQNVFDRDKCEDLQLIGIIGGVAYDWRQ